MEKNFNTDNFEQLLRETTDEFRMYPSKRVWHSLYNDLHPGRRWPSFAILLLLISSIMYVGVTNSTETASSGKAIPAPRVIISPANEFVAANTKSEIPQPQDQYAQRINNKRAGGSAINANSANPVYSASPSNNVQQSFRKALETNKINDADHTPIPAVGIAKTGSKMNIQTAGQEDVIAVSNKNNIAESNESSSRIFTTGTLAKISVTDAPGSSVDINPSSDINNTTLIQKSPLINKPAAGEKMNAAEKAWMEDFVLHNKKPARKFKNRLAYQVYITPSVGYRTLKKNTDYVPMPVTTLIANPSLVNNMEYPLNHYSAVNLEAGTNLIFSLTKKFRFKAGVQLNYTNYRINAYELNHPTFAILMLNDLNSGYPILTSRSSTLANTPGIESRNLNNNTYQVSIPLGADYKIAGNNKIKWYAGATIQPTYVAGGHAYLISSDLKNYVSGNDLMRTFNLNGGIETFVSYKTGNGVILSAGPQFRYQFLSTYSKSYTYDEKLFNLGVKLGMTTNF